MGKESKIEWTDHTFNPWWGCVKVSQGCKHCYAETWAKRTGHGVWGVDAPRRFFGEKHWQEPLKWNREAEKAGQRAKVFCGSMCDWAEIHRDPEINQQMSNARSKLFLDIIPNTPWLDWLLLTKRAENMFSLGTDAAGRIFDLYLADYPNVWLGTTVENQEVTGERIEHLSRLCASVKWLSIEPMLGPVDLMEWMSPWKTDINWVICGGESGPGCRPFEWEWARDLLHQCRYAAVPFFMKQAGGYPNKRDQLEYFPEDLRVREYPQPDKLG